LNEFSKRSKGVGCF